MKQYRAAFRLLGSNLTTAALYAGLGYSALMVTRGTGLASPIWPSAGLAFALIYQFGPRLLPGIALGSFVNNAITLRQDEAAWELVAFIAVVIALGSIAQAWAGRTLVHRIIGRHVSLVGPSQIVSFLAISGPVACLVNSTLGTLAQVSAGFVSEEKSFLVWMTWWVGDSLGVMIFGPIVLMTLSVNNEAWRRRRLFVSAPALMAVFAGIAIFLQGAALESRQLDLEIGAVANDAQHELQDEMHRVTEVLYGVRGLQASVADVSLLSFRTFTQDALRRDATLQAISWNPWLNAGEVADFERHQQRVEGLVGYRVTEKSDDGTVIPAGPRNHYAAVGFIEPLAKNVKALGFDIASDPVRNHAILTAIRTGATTATAPIDLVQEVGKQKGFLVLVPAFRTADIPTTAASRRSLLRGFAVGVYRCDDLLQSAFKADRWDGIALTLTDRTDELSPVVMGHRASKVAGTVQKAVVRDIRFAGRSWRLAVTEVTTPTSPAQLVNSPIVMLLGLTMALLLMAFLLLVSGMEHQARTDAELDALTGLHNRRALLTRLETARRRSQLLGTRHVLLVLDLDGLKRVNDSAGHDAGDRALQAFSAVLGRVVREQDTLARIGGDEFAVVLLDCRIERAVEICESIVRETQALVLDAAAPELVVGVSIGAVSIDGPDPLEGSVLLRLADLSCYEAKRSGGNGVHVASDRESRA